MIAVVCCCGRDVRVELRTWTKYAKQPGTSWGCTSKRCLEKWLAAREQANAESGEPYCSQPAGHDGPCDGERDPRG